MFSSNIVARYVHADTPANANLPRHAPCHCGAPREEHRSRARRKLDNIGGFGIEHETIEEDDEDVGSVDSRSGLIPGMVVNVHAPSDKIISSTTYTEGEVGMWKENLAMQSFPTNAYGTISFDGSLLKAAKYIRLGAKTDMSKVKELLTEHWGLTRPTPHLVLSIIGGAKNFRLDGRKKEVFKRGLIGEIDLVNIACW